MSISQRKQEHEESLLSSAGNKPLCFKNGGRSWIFEEELQTQYKRLMSQACY